MMFSIAAGLFLLALSLMGLRLYLAFTGRWLKIHLSKIESLKPAVDDALQVFREEKALISLKRLTAGFALSEALWECNEAYRWLEAARKSETNDNARRISRLQGDLYAWLILRESRDHYLVALKYAQPQDLDARALNRLSKLTKSDEFHRTQAVEFIERLQRKQRSI